MNDELREQLEEARAEDIRQASSEIEAVLKKYNMSLFGLPQYIEVASGRFETVVAVKLVSNE